MVRTLLPAVVGLIAIVSLSFYEGYEMKDRWGTVGVEAEELGERFAKVPRHLGDEWTGEDLPVDEIVRKTAGAIRYVSRLYTHGPTGKQVNLWLIVGHSRDIMRHTPNVCYPSSGFRQVGSQLRHHVDLDLKDNKEAVFYTAKFEREDAFRHQIERVFWAFNHPDTNQWESPEEGARWRYGMSKALYKLYFTSTVQADEDTIEDSITVEFAELMLPVIDKALFPTAASELSVSEAELAETEAVEPDTAEAN